MKRIGELFLILTVVIAAIFWAKSYLTKYFSKKNNSNVNISESQKKMMASLMQDPMYRPIPLLIEQVEYKHDAPIERTPFNMLSLSVTIVRYPDEGVGAEYLYVNDVPVFGVGEFITLIGAFKKSKAELIFFSTQSPGTCCGGYQSLYVLRYIQGIGLGLEFLDTMQNGVNSEEDLRRRFQIEGNSIIVDLDIWSLTHNFIKVSVEGGVEKFSRKLLATPVKEAYCSFLWESLEDYLKEYKKGRDLNFGLLEYLQRSNSHSQMYNSMINTQVSYNETNFLKIGERVIKEGRMKSDLRALFNRQVCGEKGIARK